MEAYYYEVPKKKTQGVKWAGVYAELVVNNDTRNDLIAALLTQLRLHNVSTLCLVKEIAHGEQLSKLANVHFANGQNEDSQDLITFFNQGKIRQLIGTTGIVGEGVDTKPAEFIIIAGLGKSKNQFMQQVGRGFRKFEGKESCKIIIFLDRSHKWTREHFKAQLKILEEEYGVIAQKLENL
jgi:superfamily II DNA or RNA helicase